jgi:hypothetical protein
MDYIRLANGLRVIGAAVLLAGIYTGNPLLWIPGVVIMILGTGLRIILRYQKDKNN